MSREARTWMGTFGREYTDRNPLTIEEMERLYKRNYGFSRTELNLKFLNSLEKSTSILEVGSNIGNQLMCLQKMGFSKLYGIEVQLYAIQLSISRKQHFSFVQGSASHVPFMNASFDLVFTSGLLIHINPSQIVNVMREIHRTTRKYIWGLEYYADEVTEVVYRGASGLLWKNDYAKLFLEYFDDLELVREERVRYLEHDLVDTMYLLRKLE